MTVSTGNAPARVLDPAAAAIARARRAVVAERYAAHSLAVEWRSLAELAALADDWRALAARAVEPNVFYEPAFALEAATVFGADAGALLVWSGTSPRKLLGLFPARIETRRYGVRLPVLAGWTHPYAPLSTPLVEREAAEPVIAAWLDHLGGNKELPGLMLLPYLPTQGPFATALNTVLRRGQMPAADFNTHCRAQLVSGGDAGRYIDRAISKHRRRELRRNLRRLSEAGALLFTTATAPLAVAAGLNDFLGLEARGWKGEAGTAAACHGDIHRFVAAAVGGLAAEGKVAIDRMLIDGRAIAATITLRSGDTAWFWKIAYDEEFARFSPGAMLAIALTEDLADDPTVARADSCATADHPLMDHIWRERLELCDRLIAVRPQAPFGLARRLEALRNGTISLAKTVRDRLRG
jgi:CelD/BcsL family acetyltransferase involved in cellulose biosynthesis